MKRIKRLLIGVLAFSGIVLSASLAMADDDKDRETNATVSFGQWDPNDPDLSSPLDRFLGDPAGGVGTTTNYYRTSSK
jgi:hypothetical protein